MKPVATQEESGRPPKFKDGERGSRLDRGRLSPCDDPSPRVSPSGVGGPNDDSSAGRGMGPEERRGSMNGTTATQTNCVGNSLPAKPRGRALRYCSECGQLLRHVVRTCACCGSPFKMVLSDPRVNATTVCCSWECRRALGPTPRKPGKYGPPAKIPNIEKYRAALQDYRYSRGLSAYALAQLCGVSSSSIYKIEGGATGLSKLYYERIGSLTGVW